ncbi:hypothetical protein MN608_08976 [Microdochium nivale]|nr:hypothetical protein MN608_08976 [Microdochium nivale]
MAGTRVFDGSGSGVGDILPQQTQRYHRRGHGHAGGGGGAGGGNEGVLAHNIAIRVTGNQCCGDDPVRAFLRDDNAVQTPDHTETVVLNGVKDLLGEVELSMTRGNNVPETPRVQLDSNSHLPPYRRVDISVWIGVTDDPHLPPTSHAECGGVNHTSSLASGRGADTWYTGQTWEEFRKSITLGAGAVGVKATVGGLDNEVAAATAAVTSSPAVVHAGYFPFDEEQHQRRIAAWSRPLSWPWRPQMQLPIRVVPEAPMQHPPPHPPNTQELYRFGEMTVGFPVVSMSNHRLDPHHKNSRGVMYDPAFRGYAGNGFSDGDSMTLDPRLLQLPPPYEQHRSHSLIQPHYGETYHQQSQHRQELIQRSERSVPGSARNDRRQNQQSLGAAWLTSSGVARTPTHAATEAMSHDTAGCGAESALCVRSTVSDLSDAFAFPLVAVPGCSEPAGIVQSITETCSEVVIGEDDQTMEPQLLEYSGKEVSQGMGDVVSGDVSRTEEPHPLDDAITTNDRFDLCPDGISNLDFMDIYHDWECVE